MRKVLVSTLAIALLGGSSLFAEEKTLIDFNQYEQKLANDPAFTDDGSASNEGGTQPSDQNNNANAANDNNANAQADNNAQANGEQGVAQNQNEGTNGKTYKVTPDDMKIKHWLVRLNASSRSHKNIQYSYAKSVKTKGLVGGGPRTVLGARIHFPHWNNNSFATIAPPYELPAYSVSGKESLEEVGVLHNTGQIYSITAEAYGRNYKYGLYLQLRNEAGNIEKYFMGYLFYNGWKTLTWKNPAYIENIDLRSIKRIPIIPDQGVPYKKLDSFLITRNGSEIGGNFLFYIANVKMKYDLAVIREDEDIDQEAEWGILSAKMKEETAINNKVRAEAVEIRKTELQKMAVSRGSDGTSENSGNGNEGNQNNNDANATDNNANAPAADNNNAQVNNAPPAEQAAAAPAPAPAQ